MSALRAARVPTLPLRLGAAALLALALAGCGTTGGAGADCRSETDPMTAASFQWCGDTAALGGGDQTPLRADASLVRLVPVQVQVGDAQAYYVRAQYQGQDWLYIAPDSELKLVIDGQPFDLRSRNGSRPDSAREVTGRYGVAIQEAADYLTDAGVIRAIGSARVVDLRLQATPEKAVEGRLSGPNLAPFRAFVEEYLDRR